jgi:predicted RNA-binding protein YlqC (UPF0109 family)
MLEFIRFVTGRLVEHPEAVSIRQEETPEGVEFFISAHPDDVGKIIGKQGRTISAIRTLTNLAAAKYGKRANVEVERPPGSPPDDPSEARDESPATA